MTKKPDPSLQVSMAAPFHCLADPKTTQVLFYMESNPMDKESFKRYFYK
jgi:hypothetical protein